MAPRFIGAKVGAIGANPCANLGANGAAWRQERQSINKHCGANGAKVGANGTKNFMAHIDTIANILFARDIIISYKIARVVRLIPY